MFSLAQHSMTGSFLFKFKVWKLFLKKKKKKQLETLFRGKFPGLVFIKRISEHKRGTRHLHLSEKVSKFNPLKKNTCV